MLGDSLVYSGNQPLLDIRALRKSFARGLARAHSRTFALIDVDVSLSWGEVLCVTGDEGAGKTALLQCAAGLLKRDSGVIRWFGEAMPLGAVPADVAFVSATPLYYPFLTVRDVIQSKALRADREHLEWTAVELLARLELDRRLDSRVADLSRAELRSLSIGEAIVQRPLAIIVDTSPSELRGLGGAVASALTEFSESGGAVMIGVRDALPIADAATRIVMLQEGTVRKTFYSGVIPVSAKPQTPLLFAETLH
jgi:ABC-type multidrug transport system ATPase subunit